MIGDGVEDGDVGDKAGADQAAVGQAESPGGVGGEVGDGLGPGVVAELAGVVAEVAGERAPAARVGEAAAENAVGAGHVGGVAEDGADVGFGPFAGRKATTPTAIPRRPEDVADEVARVGPACSAAAVTVIPSAQRQSGFATIAIVVVSSG